MINGLTTGIDAPLEVKEGGVCDRGVFATGTIRKGSWLCEYKTAAVYPIDQKAAIEAEYDENGEGSYIIDSTFPIPKEGRICFDATRKFNQIGRYLNHAQSPNAKLTRPYKIRGKWCIGFLSLRDIGVGEEVVWDYGVRGEEWSGCRLVGGVVRNPPTPTQQVGKEAKDGNAGEVPEMVTAPASPVKPQEVAIPTQQVGKEAKDGNAGEVPEMVTAPASPVKPQEVAIPTQQVGKEAKDGNAGEVPEMVTAPASPVKPQEVDVH